MITKAKVGERVRYIGNSWMARSMKGPKRELVASFDRELCDTGVIENLIRRNGRSIYVEVRMDAPNFGLFNWKASELVRVMVER